MKLRVKRWWHTRFGHDLTVHLTRRPFENWRCSCGRETETLQEMWR